MIKQLAYSGRANNDDSFSGGHLYEFLGLVFRNTFSYDGNSLELHTHNTTHHMNQSNITAHLGMALRIHRSHQPE